MPFSFAGILSIAAACVPFALRLGTLCCALALATTHTSLAQAPLSQAPAALAPFVTIEGDRKDTGWWDLADFHPFTTYVRGIPVNQIRKNWCKATEFSKELIPKQLLLVDGQDQMDANRVFFAVEGNLDGSATKQVALVGVYQECAGEKGSFVLILDQPISTKKARVRFVHSWKTDRQFAVLEKSKGNLITLWTCMACDEQRSDLQWDRKKRKFGWLPGVDQD